MNFIYGGENGTADKGGQYGQKDVDNSSVLDDGVSHFFNAIVFDYATLSGHKYLSNTMDSLEKYIYTRGISSSVGTPMLIVYMDHSFASFCRLVSPYMCFFMIETAKTSIYPTGVYNNITKQSEYVIIDLSRQQCTHCSRRTKRSIGSHLDYD